MTGVAEFNGTSVLDVTEPEPLPDDHPLWTLPNCIITPHVGNTPAMAVPSLSITSPNSTRGRAGSRRALCFFFAAVVAGSVTDVARHNLAGAALRRRACVVSAFLTAVAAANAAVLLSLPDALGTALLGATWAHAGNGWLFTAANGGWEYPAFLTAAAAVQALLGDGAFALGSLRADRSVRAAA